MGQGRRQWTKGMWVQLIMVPPLLRFRVGTYGLNLSNVLLKIPKHTAWLSVLKWECHLPGMEIRQRLRREYGMYPENWDTPFGSMHIARYTPPENANIRMMAVADAPPAAPAAQAEAKPKANKAFLNSLVNQIKAPTFSGNEADFADFAREWKQYIRMVSSESGVIAIGDALALDTLKRALDHASRQKLIAAMDKNPNLKYDEFWKVLETDFSRDLTGVHRKEWEKVTLGGVRNITPQMWRKFEAELQVKSSRVEDITDREKESRIKRELPEDLRHRLGEESLRVSSTRFWVKVQEPLPFPASQLQNFLRATLRKQDLLLIKSGNSYLMDCGTKRVQDAARAMDNFGFGNVALRISAYNKGMTWEEMSQWVIGQLRLREEDAAYDSGVPAKTNAIQGKMSSSNLERNSVAPMIPPSNGPQCEEIPPLRAK